MTHEQIYAALEALGSTADAVAESLRAKGVRGWRAACCLCPLAEFINTLHPGGLGAGVNRNCFSLAGGLPKGLPRACREFVELMDRGRYPFLLVEPPNRVV